MTPTTRYSLLGKNGQRKYLNRPERHRFHAQAVQCPQRVKLFCLMLYYTGARLSEIADLHVHNLDFPNGTVAIQTLKRRTMGIYRQVPLPDFLLEELNSYIGTRETHPGYSDDRLWFFSTRTASRYVKSVMDRAGIEGHRASARGLRHGFAVWAVLTVPVTQVQVWMGHAYLQTTSLYVKVSGVEEREMAEKLWAAG